MSRTATDAARIVGAAGTTFAVEDRGEGPPLLLIHGGGEDATMLRPQAERFAAGGHRVITYDRRGTGGSGRDDWPGRGAGQHADDAVALLDALDIGGVLVVGVSSGGVIALDLTARHPDVVERVLVWEIPAVGVLANGPELNAMIMAPIEAHLRERPGDFVGAQAILLSAVIGAPVAVDDPLFAATRANAEPMIRDEPSIVLRPFTAEDVAGRSVTVAVGGAPNDIICAASEQIAMWLGRPLLTIAGAGHEVYLTDPDVLANVVGDRQTCNRAPVGPRHGSSLI